MAALRFGGEHRPPSAGDSAAEPSGAAGADAS
jgi:hypothetical protein